MKYSISSIKSSSFHAFVHLSWHVIKVSQYMMLTIKVYTYIEKIYHVKSDIFCLFIDRGASMRCSFGFWELPGACFVWQLHYDDVIMGAMASQIASLGIVYSAVYSRRRSKKHQLRLTGLCGGNSPVTGEFPARTSNAENGSIWWLHHALWPRWRYMAT